MVLLRRDGPGEAVHHGRERQVCKALIWARPRKGSSTRVPITIEVQAVTKLLDLGGANRTRRQMETVEKRARNQGAELEETAPQAERQASK
jgi:hypothetical protein